MKKSDIKLVKTKKQWRIPCKGKIPDVDLKILRRQYKHFTRMRSEVLDEALHIEHYLSVLILHFLAGNNYDLHELLWTFIFDADFCTFMQKRKMLSLIFEMYPKAFTFLSAEEINKVKRELNNLILDRDMFAHGTIFFTGPEGKWVIEYYRGGRTETELSEEVFSRVLRRCKYLNQRIEQINDFLREKGLGVGSRSEQMNEDDRMRFTISISPDKGGQ